MQITVSGFLNQFQRIMQGVLFPALQQQLGLLTDKHRQLVAVLGLIQIEALVGSWPGGVGRPAKHRRAMACSFVAKAVYNMSHTCELLDRLKSDASLRRICGWEWTCPHF
ncbi:MAG: transposase [Acidobacteriaceae bacterium]